MTLRFVNREFVIREARKVEFEALGRLAVSVYSTLEGFPGRSEQPRYYAMLTDIGQFSEKPDTKLLVAVEEERVLGCVVYFSQMAQYGSGGTASEVKSASGFRLLAVDPAARGRGVGKGLAMRCIEFAKEKMHSEVVIHTTKAMKVAWGMYQGLGFERSPDLDFVQEGLPVFGFRLRLKSRQ